MPSTNQYSHSGFGAVELLGQDPPSQTLQLPEVSGVRQRGVSNMEAQVEPIIVHPDGLTEARYPLESLTEPRELLQLRLGEREHPLEIDAADLIAQRCRVVQRHRADVHVRAAVLHGKEAQIHRGKPLEMDIGHGGASFTRGACRRYRAALGSERPRS